MVFLVGVQGQGDAIRRSVYCYVYSLGNHLNGVEFILCSAAMQQCNSVIV